MADDDRERDADARVAIYNRILSMEALLQARIDGLFSLHEAKLDSLSSMHISDIRALRKEIHSLIVITDGKLRAHTLEAEERFKSVELRFTERDKRFDVAAWDNSKANEKSETLFNNHIKQLFETFGVSVASINKQIDDIKERLTRSEGYAKGAGGLWSGLLSGVSAAIALGTFLIIIFHLRANT